MCVLGPAGTALTPTLIPALGEAQLHSLLGKLWMELRAGPNPLHHLGDTLPPENRAENGPEEGGSTRIIPAGNRALHPQAAGRAPSRAGEGRQADTYGE